MKWILFLLTIFYALEANAQTYIISFTGIGEATTVSSVKVENLTSGATASLTSSGQTLTLSVITDADLIDNQQSKELKIYPNPMTDNSIMQVNPPVAGDATISIHEMAGRLIARIDSYLENYLQEFRLTGINSGYYLITVEGRTYKYSGKLLSNAKASSVASIEKVNSNVQPGSGNTSKMDSKGEHETINMEYTIGDRLKYIGISGNYSTVITDIPVEDKTITFTFIACTDGDGNNYPVVEIGGQIWMAENLKTTKYNDNSDIPNVIEKSAWYLLQDGAFCWYENDISNGAIHGALYNCFAVIDPRNLCPTGWHVPGHLYPSDEWPALITYLGGKETAGGKMKSVGTVEAGTGLWNSPNYNATNESGFSALPGGVRYYDGTFTNIGNIAYFWSSSMPYFAFLYLLANSNDQAPYLYDHPNQGLSVRCIKD